MYTVYGIPNCDTVKKAIKWLKTNNIPHEFHDYKKEGISPEKLQQWSGQLGFEKLLNTKGTTWRGLAASDKALANGANGALQLMAQKTSLIKRPLIEKQGKVVALGFDEMTYEKLLQP